MGVLHGRDLLSSKYITAIICDASNRLHFVPIKTVFGDYFFTVLDDQLYAFKLDGTRIMQYREKVSRSFQVLFYTTDHYLPISKDIKDLELTLFKNNVSKLDEMLFSIFKILGKREPSDPKDFTPHDIAKVLDKLKSKEDKFSIEIRNMITYLDHLDVDKIVKPVRRISEFIEGELLATDPKFMGVVASLAERNDKGHQIVSNAKIGGKHDIMKFMLVIVAIAFIGILIYFAYEQGYFDDITQPFERIGDIEYDLSLGSSNRGIGGGDTRDVSYWTNNYTPEELKTAVDRGEVNYETLPPAVKEMVDNVKLPEVSQKIELGG